jgi:hypothetical protein
MLAVLAARVTPFGGTIAHLGYFRSGGKTCT